MTTYHIGMKSLR